MLHKLIICLVLFLSLLQPLPAVGTVVASEPLMLWFKQPASDWNEALPVG